MKRRVVAMMLAIAIPALIEVRAQSGAAAPYPVIQGKVFKFEKVAEGVYYASGGLGSNDTVIVNDQDVILVDDGSTPATARDLIEDIKAITDKPIRVVINTHFHYDHTNGNAAFSPSEVQIIAHEYARKALLTLNPLNREPYISMLAPRVPVMESLERQIAEEKDAGYKAELEKRLAATKKYWQQVDEVRVVPPNVTFTSKLVLYRGQREIQLLFLGRGHTGGDTVVFLPKERIVSTGDLMDSQIPFLADGIFDEWITTLDALKALDFGVVLPGHGSPFTDKGRITAFQRYLKDLMYQVASLRKRGESPEDAARHVDLLSFRKDFPDIRNRGAEVRGVRRIYEWLAEQGK